MDASEAIAQNNEKEQEDFFMTKHFTKVQTSIYPYSSLHKKNTGHPFG